MRCYDRKERAVLEDLSFQHVFHPNTVYVPRVGLDFEKFDMEMLRIDHLLSSADEIETMWPRNKWKIPEPPVLEGEEQLAYADGAASAIDLLIMPGVAFDRLGNRLGQGKGYYDR